MKFKKYTAGCLLLATAILAAAHGFKAGDVTIAHPWARATPPAAKAGGVFMQLTSIKGDQLLKAESALADKVEIHEMKMDGNTMTMSPVPQLDLPAGKEVSLAPGSYHIMLFGLKQALKAGDSFPLTLTFAKAGRVQVEVSVEAMAKPASGTVQHQHGSH
ncbi:copper chaperone PCu(A)C [Chitinilyticum piscinae]|uniref:Copper chaperone PCu(A)C n=1 Tax=Chitinilyticum piscinae TaxID=2866724 RepID=A0A8J7FMV6_9NEIS|nr:copper chaperone PCu(A)C [Chitinilyticum piscinae]MBE9610992.1 copper chaperone PCu(A)C [Chitinilyticum piscinae]